jgi:hypothetical protein
LRLGRVERAGAFIAIRLGRRHYGHHRQSKAKNQNNPRNPEEIHSGSFKHPQLGL